MNIVFILADDFGYMDLTAFAAKVKGVNRSECYYETPNLDLLADQGIAFTQAYANQLCSPSRASILSRIEAAGYDVFRHRPKLGRADWLVVAWNALCLKKNDQ